MPLGVVSSPSLPQNFGKAAFAQAVDSEFLARHNSATDLGGGAPQRQQGTMKKMHMCLLARVRSSCSQAIAKEQSVLVAIGRPAAHSLHLGDAHTDNNLCEERIPRSIWEMLTNEMPVRFSGTDHRISERTLRSSRVVSSPNRIV